MAELFEPSPEELPDIAELIERIEAADWEDAKDIAAIQGWVWDESAGQYKDGDRVVTNNEILEVIYAELEDFEGQVSDLAATLTDGGSVKDFESGLLDIAIAAAMLFYLFGLGTRQNLAGNEDFFVERLTTQVEYLRLFSEDILAGNLTAAKLVARANLYPQDDQLMYSQAQEIIHRAGDWPYYSNVLGGCQHCWQCPDETAKGIVWRGELTPIGERQCLWRCCCSYQYHRTASGTDSYSPLLTAKRGWIGTLRTNFRTL